jgi:hypothetical protein
MPMNLIVSEQVPYTYVLFVVASLGCVILAWRGFMACLEEERERKQENERRRYPWGRS